MAHYSVGDEPVPGYRLAEWLGEGGFGVAWKATAPGGAEVCLKIIDLGHQAKNKKAAKERRALELVKRIRHPHLASILAFWLKDSQGQLLDDATIDAGESAGTASAPSLKDTMVLGPRAWQSGPAELIIAMDLGEQSLSQRLEECQAAGSQGIPIDELLRYLEGAADAIDYLNADHNILHGDIKPQNILVVARGAKVCDYGLARTLEGTRTANVAATLAYAAPELLDNKPGRATDQYSLAITYIELRTGSLPFDDDSATGVMRAHMEGTLNLTRLMEGERDAIRRATALDPNARYDSAYKMVRALRRAHEATLGTETLQTPPVPPAPKPPSKTDEIVPGYRLLGQPVRSGMEEVWEATVPGGKRVALSIRRLGDSAAVLDFDALSLAPKLKHQNLAEVDSYWLIDREGMVLADEHLVAVDRARLDKLVLSGKLSNSTLLHWLGERQQRTGKGLPASELLPRMRQVADAIDYLNQRRHQVRGRKVSLLHCNVQPANLLLFGQEVRLGSLGRLRTLNADMVDDSNAAANFEATYTPPEAFHGRITRWTDQYALALAYVHLRTGQPAFDVANSTTRLIQMRSSGKLNFRELPEREVEVLLRATALEPAERFDTCGDLIAALLAAFEKRPSDALPSTGTGTESGGKSARPDISKTALIDLHSTKLLDEKHSSTQDTSPPEPSVIDTHPVQPVDQPVGTRPAAIDPLAIDAARDRSKTGGTGGWRPSPSSGVPGHARLLVATGAIALLLALGSTMAWTHWFSRDSTSVDPFLTTLDSLMERAANMDDRDAAGLLALDAQLQNLKSDPAAAQALDSRTRDVQEFQKRVSLMRMRQLLERDLAGESTAAELEQFVISLVELQTVLDEQAADDPTFRQNIDRVYREHRRRIAELHDKARQVARAGSDPTAAKSLLARLVQFDADNFVSWLALARLELTTGEWLTARQWLEKVANASTANPDAVRSDSLNELRLLQAWVDIKNQVSSTADSIGKFKDLVDKVALPEEDVVLVSDDLVKLGEQDEFTAACIDTLKTADAAYPGNQTLQANLITLMERWLPHQVAFETNLDEKWFETRRNECELILDKGDSASPYRPFVELLYAECLVEPEGANYDPRAKQHLDEAGTVSQDHATHATYVAAIVTQANPQSGAAPLSEKLNLLADHLGQGASSAGMSALHRRRRSAELFALAADSLREPYDRGHPIEQALTNPFGSFQNAANAAAWLQCHQALHDDPLDLQPAVNLALAAYYSALSPHPATARAAAEALVPRFSEIGDDRLALSWILARTQPLDPAGRRTALEQSDSLVKEFTALRPLADLDVAPALMLQREVIAPALSRITQVDTQISLLFDSVGLARAHLAALHALPDDSRTFAARLYATHGHLLLNNSDRAEWKLDLVATRNKAYRAFDRAIRLDPSSADYLVARASVRRFMPERGGWQAARKDLEDALQLDDKHAPAHYQKALVLEQQAMTLSLQDRLELFDSARKSCEQALEVTDAEDRERANYLVQLSSTHVNLGILHFQLENFAKCDEHLKLAESIGQEAVRDEDGTYAYLAYRALGNAQEARARISAARDPMLATYYEEAARSFEMAIKKNPGEAQSYRDFGRLRYRQAVDSRRDAAQAQNADAAKERDRRLEKAQANFHRALLEDPGLNEVRYWAAMASSAQGDHLVAAESFQQYFARAKAFKPDDASDYVHASLQSLQNLHFAIQQGRSPGDMLERLAAARECARRITELTGQDSSRFDAKNASIALLAFADALESEANAVASLSAIQRALPADRAALQANPEHYLELLVAQVHCRLRAPPTVREAVDESDRSKRYLLYRDVELLGEWAKRLHTDYKTKLPVARHLPPMAASAWGGYEVSNFIHVSEAQRQLASAYSVSAIKSLRELIAAEPHHFDACYWRWCARQRFVAELNARTPGQTVLPNTELLARYGQPSTQAEFRQEFLSYIEYALQRTPDEEHPALREEERRFKALQ